MTPLSSLLSSIRSSGPTLPLLRQIPQPILIEWARGEIEEGEEGDKILSAGLTDSWGIPCVRVLLESETSSRKRMVLLSLIFRPGLACLLSLCASIDSLLSILRARQAHLESRCAVQGWQGETEGGLIEDLFEGDEF